MKDLLRSAQDYLRAEGWEVRPRGRDLLLGDKDSSRGDNGKEYLYVWVPSDAELNLGSREGPYLRRFEEAKEEHPTAEMVFLVRTLGGLSTEFRKGARRWHGVKIVVPAQFFDTDFRWERNSRAASATSELRNQGTEDDKRRISQPFQVVQSPNPVGDQEESDLLDVLHDRIRNQPTMDDTPTIHIVVGPAGMGKSVLFRSLYARLYNDFQSDKQARHLSARPYALLPEHLPDAPDSSVASMLEAYLRTEFAGTMSRRMFDWKLVNGLGTWLLDGLDEILERDAHFFDYLEDLMTMPGEASPSIVICVRDSLFTTHRGLQDFCEGDCRSSVTVYQLDGWQHPSKSAFARIRLASKDGAEHFVRSLTQRPALDALASTPYYCELLVEEFRGGGLRSGGSEADILERALERIIDRERSKGLLQDIPDHGIWEFVESCASINVLEGAILIDDVRVMAEVVISEWIDEADNLSKLAIQMGQIPLFARGLDGRLRFAQEPLEHYLAARHMARSLQSNAANLTRRELSKRELSENVMRLMFACIDAESRDSVWQLLKGMMLEKSIAGRNALGLAIQMSGGTDRLAGMQFADVDLSGMRFDGHVLRDTGFDRVDLTNVDFRESDLSRCSFVSCLMKGTRFGDDKQMLSTIKLEDMRKFYSAYVGESFVDSSSILGELFGKSLTSLEEAETACPTARQLRHIFGKFVEETGRGRRKDLARRAILRGKQLVAHPEAILNEAIRSGYLVDLPSRDRISRAQDDQYREMVKFRVDLSMSPGISALLGSTCELANCPHMR